MGLEQADQALDESLNKPSSTEGDPEKASSSEETSEKNSPSQDLQNNPQIVDLDSLDKVKYKGRELTREELERTFMFQSDYTKKTQALSEDRKYYDNLQYDLENVIGNPKLVQKFKEVYPEKFHKFLEYAVKNTSETEAQVPQQVQNQQAVDPAIERILGEISELKATKQEWEAERMAASTQKAEAHINEVTAKYGKKYDLADEETVLSRAQMYWEKNKEELRANKQSQIPEAAWEQIYKSVHERNQQNAEKYWKTKVDKQTKANESSKDIASGGGTPGQAPKRLTMSEATQAAIDHYEGRG